MAADLGETARLKKKHDSIDKKKEDFPPCLVLRALLLPEVNTYRQTRQTTARVRGAALAGSNCSRRARGRGGVSPEREYQDLWLDSWTAVPRNDQGQQTGRRADRQTGSQDQQARAKKCQQGK
ncbi:hypothetical protein IF2G_08635 [Cordyceps javanica]|nr:hypothetical protein IF2G_08635 [Cordyceps javanica]